MMNLYPIKENLVFQMSCNYTAAFFLENKISYVRILIRKEKTFV